MSKLASLTMESGSSMLALPDKLRMIATKGGLPDDVLVARIIK